MAPSSSSNSKGISKKAKEKNPAEFFAENQNIAGFDNPGKALYTTVREFVENSLDACESIGVLPNVELTLTELSNETFAKLRGMGGASGRREDAGLYTVKKSKKKGKKGKKKDASLEDNEDDSDDDIENSGLSKGGSDDYFFKLTCKDNGSGMLHDQVPGMFGRVLSGSNYAVKQARGKFGLGAKMALIWSKKSTGLPIQVLTGHSSSSSVSSLPKFLTFCKVDIDIDKNEPKVHQHDKLPNPDGWRGAEVSLIMSGNWTKFRRSILSYLQQLAVITPYAQFDFKFESEVNSKKNITKQYARRSEQLCKLSMEVKHHPKAVNDLVVRQLLSQLARPKTTSLPTFLQTQFSCIEKSLAQRLAVELDKRTEGDVGPDSTCADLNDKQVHQVAQLLRDTTAFPEPSADCLSPAGEYNLRLGIMKEFEPDLVATSSSNPVVYNGHPALVEAAVALGSKKQRKPGLSIFRFANRIPLLFEPGSDVVTIVSNKSVKWQSYLINPNMDKISIFVSIVSTKIPFKGTGKEFIGNDVEPIRRAVHESLTKCALQLKAKVALKRQAKERDNRMNNLIRYIPDVSRALSGIVALIKENANKPPQDRGTKRQRLDSGGSSSSSTALAPAAATQERNPSLDAIEEMERELLSGKVISEQILAEKLQVAVNQADMDSAMELVKKRGRGQAQRVPFFLLPKAPNELLMAHPISDHPLLQLRLFAKAQKHH